MVHILHMPPTQKTLGCSCTEDANPTAIRKQESQGNEADISKKESQGNGVDLIMIKKKKKKKKRKEDQIVLPNEKLITLPNTNTNRTL